MSNFKVFLHKHLRRSGSNEMLVLLLDAGLVGLVIAAPALGAAAVAVAVAMQKETKPQRIQASWHYLRSKNLISIKRDKGNTTITLTRKGKYRAESYQRFQQLRQLQMKKKIHWDKKWRIVMFDVPASERQKRDAFRSFLKRLGFAQLQKSAWVYPHDCTKELELLKEFFHLSENQLRLVVADSIGGQDISFRRKFNIKI